MNNVKEMKIKFIDLFAGTGAFTLAFEKNNKFNCIFANDMIVWSLCATGLESYEFLSKTTQVPYLLLSQHDLSAVASDPKATAARRRIARFRNLASRGALPMQGDDEIPVIKLDPLPAED